MKEIHLSYNEFRGAYVFYEGKNGSSQHNRNEWKSSQISPRELLKRIDSLIDLKRRSVFYLENLPDEIVLGIEELVRDSKVELDYSH